MLLTLEQYEALIALARRGATTNDDQHHLNTFLKSIEQSNGIVRYSLWIQWQEMSQPLPPSTKFPSVWPPNMRFFLENITRPIAKTDVLTVVANKANKPTNILVTPDPTGLVGWTPVDLYFVS